MTSLPGTRPGTGRGWGVRLRAPSPKSHLPGARRRLRLKSLRKREGGLEILFSFVPATGAGSRRPGRGPRDWGSPRRGEERNKGCAAPGSPSPRPNFARGARVPGELARCAENPGVRAEPGLGGVRRRRFPRPRPPGRDPGASRRQRVAEPCKESALPAETPRMPLALAGRPRAPRSGPYGAPPSPAVLPEPG